MLAVDSAAAPQAETQSTDVIIPDIAGREAPVIEADGASSVIGRGDMELAEGGRPLTFSAGQGQTLTVDSNIFDPLAYTLSGDIDPNSAVVSEPTPKQNLAASQWTSFGQIQVTDSLDRTYLLDVYLTKTSANDWEVDVFDSAAAPANGGFPYTSGPLATDQLVYSNGQLQSGGSFAVTTPDGGTINLDLSSVAEANATISGNLSSDATIVSGSTPTANLTTSAYSAELSLNVVNTMGVSEAIDLYFTQTTANAWRAAAFAGSTTPGVFPYAGAPLADETLTFDASGAVASGGSFFIAGAKGADVTLDLSSLIENSSLTSLLATPISQQTSIDGNLSVTAASDTGSLPSNDVSGSTYTTELTLDALSETGASTPLDVYFTKTAASTWQVAAFASESTPGVFPYSGSTLGVETLTFNQLGTIASGAQLAISGGGGFVLNLSAITKNAATSSLSAATPTYADSEALEVGLTPIPSASGQGPSVAVTGGGTVRLGGLNTFTSGVEIDDGTLELGSSSVGWGGQSPTFYQVQTQDGAGDALTLDVYLAKISNGASSGYEVTVYNAADEAIGGGFPFSSSALGSDDFYLDSSGKLVGSPLMLLTTSEARSSSPRSESTMTSPIKEPIFRPRARSSSAGFFRRRPRRRLPRLRPSISPRRRSAQLSNGQTAKARPPR